MMRKNEIYFQTDKSGHKNLSFPLKCSNKHAVDHQTASQLATLPRIVTFRWLHLGICNLGAGILLPVELLLLVTLSTIMTVVCLPDRSKVFGVVNLIGFPSGIGLLGRSRFDQQRRRDLGVLGPKVSNVIIKA